MTSPNRLGDGRPPPALPEGEYVMLKDASTEVTCIGEIFVYTSLPGSYLEQGFIPGYAPSPLHELKS